LVEHTAEAWYVTKRSFGRSPRRDHHHGNGAEREGIDDDLERAERYVRDIAHDHPEVLDEAAMLVAQHVASTNRSIEEAGIPA
jgi:sigma54-dependent transcription regulator